MAVQPAEAHAGRYMVARAKRHTGREHDIDGIGVRRFRPVGHNPERFRAACPCRCRRYTVCWTRASPSCTKLPRTVLCPACARPQVVQAYLSRRSGRHSRHVRQTIAHVPCKLVLRRSQQTWHLGMVTSKARMLAHPSAPGRAQHLKSADPLTAPRTAADNCP